MLILVPSHDDAESLRASLPRIRAAMRPGKDTLVVIADRCTDTTAQVARELGAEVVVREDETQGPGKGGALRFALSVLPADGASAEAVAIFDADSLPDAGFFALAETRLAAGERALQAWVDPVPGRPLASRIAAYSEIVSQKISDRIREILGWGVPFRGTGMVVERRLLEPALGRCATFVEDLELTLILAADGVAVRRLAVRVADPKPTTVSGVVAQRARWLAGNLAALSARRREILRLLRTPSGATLVLSLFSKPRSLFFSGRVLLFLGLLALPASSPVRWLAAAAGLFLARDVALLVGGLFVVDRPAFYLPAVIASPVYPLLWVAGAARSLYARRRWLSARRPA
jgi:cellulose synthase/poly-beta-1,6-N-acetylglucosamine synthase-like glycosyltransferase